MNNNLWLSYCRLKAFLIKDFWSEKRYFADRVMNFLATVMSIGIFYFISRMIDMSSSFSSEYGVDYFSFVFIGIIFIWYFYLLLNGFTREIKNLWHSGILEVMISSPLRVFELLIGMNLWNIIVGFIQLVLFLIIGKTFYGINVSYGNIFLAGFIFLVSGLIFISIGMISAAISMFFIFKREPLVFVIHCVISLLCGVYFPVSLLPLFWQKISFLLPMTYALRGLRKTLLKDYPLEGISTDLTVLVISLVVIFSIAVKLFNCSLNRLKQKGRCVYYG